MPLERLMRPFSSSRLVAAARSLLDATTLCAIATVSPAGRPHVNTAYFARSDRFDLVWLSDPDATHSRNVRNRPLVSIAVYDSGQSWGAPDRGIQLFGTARETGGSGAREAERVYARRFPDYRASDFPGYRLYRFRPRREKLFDERALGSGAFVTASIRGGQLGWARTRDLSGRLNRSAHHGSTRSRNAHSNASACG